MIIFVNNSQMIMNYISQSQLANNPNGSFGLTLPLQQHLASENAQFIIELAREMKTSYSIPTLALHIATVFFHKKSYIHFDRYLILTASYLLASKIKNMDCKLKNLCNVFYNVISRKTMGVEPYNEEKMKKLKEHISIYEAEILRSLQYDIDSVTPHDYLKRECELLFPGDREVNRKIHATTRILIIDSYRSRCCLVFPPLVIFVTCFLIANRYEGKKPYDSPITRSACKQQNPDEYELYKLWLEALGTRQNQQIPSTAVRDCLRMVNSILPCGY